MFIFKKRQMTAIWKDMLNLMQTCGLTNVSYSGYPAERWRFYRSTNSTLSRKLFDYQNRPFCGGLSNAPAEMGRLYFKENLSSDPIALRIEDAQIGTMVTSAMFCGQKEYQKIDDFFNQWNAGCRIAISLPSLSEHWYPVLTASGDMMHKEGGDHIVSISHMLVDKLLSYNMEMILHYGDYFNPFRAHQVFSSQAQGVLKLISAGFTNKEAAERTSLTQDGIKYHLKTMRTALGARNIAQLVSLSKELQIV